MSREIQSAAAQILAAASSLASSIRSLIGIKGADGYLKASASNPFPVSQGFTVSTANAYDTTLGSGATYTGTAEAWGNAQRVDILINTDVSGGVLHIDFYNSALNSVKRTITRSNIGTGGRFLSFEREGSGYRIRFVNGVGSAALYIQATLACGPRSVKADPIEDPLTADSSAQPVRAIIEGRSSSGGGTYVAVKVTPSGALASEVTQGTSPWVVSGSVSSVRPATSTRATITLAGAAATVQASNTNRLGWTIFNNSGGIVYLKKGSGASPTDYFLQMTSGSFYELPQPCYTGIITAYGTGDVLVSEDTP